MMQSSDASPTNAPPKIKSQDINRKLATDQLNLLYANLAFSIPSGFICATLVFLTLYSAENNLMLAFGWYALVITVSLFRLSLFYFYRKYPYNQKKYLILFQIGIVLSASLWGVVDSYLMPSDLIHQVIIFMIVIGIAAGSIQTLHANLIACYIYIILTVTPLAIWLSSQMQFAYLILSASLWTYLFFMLIAALRVHQLLISSWKLSYENIKLVENLTSTNIKMKQTNDSLAISNERFQSLMKNSPLGTGIVNLKGYFIDANDALCKYLGYSKKELLTKAIQDITYPDDLAPEMVLINKLIADEIPYFRMDKRHIHKDGHLIWSVLTVTKLKSPTGKMDQLTGQILDISERKQNEEKLAQLSETMALMLNELNDRERVEALINKMNDMLQTCTAIKETFPRISLIGNQLFPDLSGALAIYNTAHNKMFVVEQWGAQKLLKSEYDPNDCFGIRSGKAVIADDPTKDIPCPHYILPPTGGYLCQPLIIQGKPLGEIFLFAPPGKAIPKNQKEQAMIFANVAKITLSNIRFRELLKEQSIHDPLTGLYNRRYLDEVLAHEIQRTLRTKTKLCIAMLDLDNFKSFNDSFGHEAGDEILRYVGNILQENFKGNNIACRFGGKEFLLVISDMNVNLQSAIDKIDTVHTLIQNATIIFQNMILPPISSTIGISIAPDHGDTPEKIIAAADEALYRGKQDGKNRIKIYRE